MSGAIPDEKPEEEQTSEERMAWLRARGVLIEEPACRRKAGAPGPSPTGGKAFRYVKIPYEDNQAVQELQGDCAEGDALPRILGPNFAGSDGLTDEMLRAHAKAQGQDVDVSALRTVMAQGGAESFRLAVPTDGNCREGVYAYIDEASALKGLPKNARATALAQQCGLPPSCVLSGNVYVGRQRWTSGGLLENADFLSEELDPSSLWIRRAPTDNLQFQKDSQPEAHEAAQASGDGLASGEADGYAWRDEGESVEVEVQVDEGVTKKDVKIEYKRQELRVLKPVQLTLKLFKPVDTDGCNWTLANGKVVVTMEKCQPEAWPQLLV